MTATKAALKVLILTSFYLLVSCKGKNNEPAAEDEIVLKIGTFKITRYEFEKNKKKEFEQQKTTDSIAWIRKYIADSYFLADAYNRKYDTSIAINKRVNYAAISMLGKYKGYLWNKIEEPKLTFSDEELKAIYQKGDKLFRLEYLLLDNKNSFDVLKSAGEIKTEADFRKYVDLRDKKRVQYRIAMLTYPFAELSPVKDEIYKSKPGEVIQTSAENEKTFVIYISKVEKYKQQQFEAEKQNIYANARHLREKQIVDNKQDSIFRLAVIVINNNAAREVLKKIKGPFIPDIPKTLQKDTLLKYFLDKKIHAVLVSEFADYYQNNPFSYIITNKNGLTETLKGMVIEKYLYVESTKLGLIKDKKYILDRKNFKNRLVLDAYSRDNFHNIKPSETAVLDYYKVNQQRFIAPKACRVSVFIFNDFFSAGYNLFNIQKMLSAPTSNFSDTSILKNLLSYRPGMLLSNKKYPYPANVVATIFSAKLNSAIGPFEWNDKGYIFVKTYEEGKEPQPLDLARETIEKELTAKTAGRLKEKKLKELKSKYDLSINKLIAE